MAVDYDEGRRLLAAWRETIALLMTPNNHKESAIWAAKDKAEKSMSDWMVTHAEALLNPDPWRPTSKEPSALALRNTVEIYGSHIGSQLSDHLLDAATYVEEVATHFRELKGPGQ